MAEIVTLQNSTYEFEIFLISIKDGKSPTVLPISKSSIKYLEVDNDLVEMGYTGNITFVNFYSILEKLQVLDLSDDTPYLYVRFKNLDFDRIGAQSDEVYFMASLLKGVETSENIIDRHVSFEFEELSISKIRRTNIIDLQNIGANPGNTTQNDGLLNSNTVAEVIQNYFVQGVYKANINDIVEATIVGRQYPGKIDPASIINLKNSDSYFSAIDKLYPYLAFETDISGWYAPGILKLENRPGYKRILIIDSLADEIQKFFALAKTDPTNKDLALYITEKFNLSQSAETPYFSENYIDKYDLKRVDYDDVFENKWTSIELVDDGDCQGTFKLNYDTLRTAFENIFTRPFASNLPKRKKDVETGSVKNTQFMRPGIGRDIATIYGINKVFKSFIFDNIALTFRTKGQPYRDPGKFIQITVDNVNLVSNNADISEVNGFWYVIAVNHIFENDTYYNDYTCVKFYSNSGELSTLPTPPLETNEPTGSVNTNVVNDGVIFTDDLNTLPLLPLRPESSSEINDGSVLPQLQQTEPQLEVIPLM